MPQFIKVEVAAGVSTCMALAPYLVLQRWNTFPADKLMAQPLNLALMLPAAAKMFASHQTPAIHPPRSKVSDTAASADRQT